jgi:hypothetical protein
MAILVADADSANLDVDVPIVQLKDWSRGKREGASISSVMNIQSKSTMYRESVKADAIKVSADSVQLNPKQMKLNLFYLAEFNGKRYLYRKISGHEIEVYEFAK